MQSMKSSKTYSIVVLIQLNNKLLNDDIQSLSNHNFDKSTLCTIYNGLFSNFCFELKTCRKCPADNSKANYLDIAPYTCALLVNVHVGIFKNK